MKEDNKPSYEPPRFLGHKYNQDDSKVISVSHNISIRFKKKDKHFPITYNKT